MSVSILSPAARQQARQALLARLDQVQAACGTRFPLFAISPDGPWQSSAGGSWMGGFWAGSWHLRAKLQASNGSMPECDAAQSISAALAAQMSVDSINRSMIFWYGAGLPASWGQNAPLLDAACKALANSFDHKRACFVLGSAQGGGAAGKHRIGIDSLAACISLLCTNAEPAHHALARQHTDTLLRVVGGMTCVAPDSPLGAWHSEAHAEEGGFLSEGLPGDWSRGQAWAMLGLSRAAAQWGEPYLQQALLACDYWQQTRPTFPPPDRLHAPQSLPDPSASLIAALAQLALAAQLPASQALPLQQQAEQGIASLVHSGWFSGWAELDTRVDAALPVGIFSGCCYTTRPGRRQLVETPWGSFLLLAALAILDGELSPQQC